MTGNSGMHVTLEFSNGCSHGLRGVKATGGIVFPIEAMKREVGQLYEVTIRMDSRSTGPIVSIDTALETIRHE